MSRIPSHVLDKSKCSWSSDNSSSSTVFMYDDKVVLYTAGYVGLYKYRLYKSLNLLYKYSKVKTPHFGDYKVHRIEVKKLDSLSKYMFDKYVQPERNYFDITYINRYGSLGDWPNPKEMLNKVLNDPKLSIYKLAFAPLRGMRFWTQFAMDDCTFNFMYDRDTKRVIPMDMFI